MSIYRHISGEKAHGFPVSRLCELLGVSASGYYAWPGRAELRLAEGVGVSRKRVERLMGQAGLSGLVRRKRGGTTLRVPGVRVADDLVQRQLRPAAPDALWIADPTYLRTGEGWLYLAAVQDAHSRRIVGWSKADHMRAQLVVDALQMAVARRRSDEAGHRASGRRCQPTIWTPIGPLSGGWQPRLGSRTCRFAGVPRG